MLQIYTLVCQGLLEPVIGRKQMLEKFCLMEKKEREKIYFYVFFFWQIDRE